MARPRTRLALPLLAAALLAVPALTPPAGASLEAPGRFEVLQAAYYSFGSTTPTHQPIGERCVLLEQYANATGEAGERTYNASDELLNRTIRSQLAFAAFHPWSGSPSDPVGTQSGTEHFTLYYRAENVPTALFDGVIWEVGAGPTLEGRYRDLYGIRANESAGASINASGSIVISSGFLDFEVFSPLNLSVYKTVLGVALVEDHVEAPGGREIRYLVRNYLGGFPLDLRGNSTVAGRVNFSTQPSWIESQLGAVLFVQVENPRPSPRPPGAVADDILALLSTPVAIAATSTALLAILVAYSLRERRARRD